MGHLSYLFFYLAAGVFAGLGFVMNGGAPLVGASGAIAGVTTAYLVLFPHSEVNLFYWIWFYIGSTQVRAMLLIVIKIIIWDNMLAPNLAQQHGVNNVAYSAHIAGYVFGFVLCFLLLLIRALPRDQYDILALAKRSYQRQQYKAMMADPNAQAQARFGRVARPVSVFTGRPIDASVMAADEEIVRRRTDISNALARGDYAAAVGQYEQLVAKEPGQVLSRKNMLAVANQLMTMGRYPQAAAAYEKHLAAYPTDDDRFQIKFLLGVIYAKYLQQNEPAEKLFRDCASNMTDPGQREQASQWLAAVANALGGGPATSEA
jgi:tetratricopeptide (TPR) repeat protein